MQIVRAEGGQDGHTFSSKDLDNWNSLYGGSNGGNNKVIQTLSGKSRLLNVECYYSGFHLFTQDNLASYNV